MIIRKMVLADLPAVIAIEKESFLTPWSYMVFIKEIKTNSFAYYFTAETEKETIVGYIGTWVIFDEIHITNIAVHPRYRRQGIGKKLLEIVYRLAKLFATKQITLEVRRSNRNARKLYEREGFVEVGTRPGYYWENNEDAIIMTLYLA